MLELQTLLELYKNASDTRNPNKLTKFFRSIEATPLPTSIAIDKARAIQLSDGNEYSIKDAEDILRQIIKIDPSAVAAYLELGCLLDAVLERSDEAVEMFNNGINRANALLGELYHEKAKIHLSRGEFSEVLTILELYAKDDMQLRIIYEEALSIKNTED